MNKDSEIEDGLVIKANDTDMEILVEDFPSADESDVDPALVSSSEPEPFDPMTSIKYPKRVVEPVSGEVASGKIEISAEQEEAMERAYIKKAPTPESVAAELKAAAKMRLVKYEDEDNGEEGVSRKKKKPIVTIVFLFIILAISGAAVAHVLLSNGKNPSVNTGEQSNTEEAPIKIIAGSWESTADDGSCYVFTENEEFYWSKKCSDFKNSYYYGKILNINRGNSALSAAKKTEEEIKKTFPTVKGLNMNSVFYFELQTVDRKVGQDGTYNLPMVSSDPVGFIFVRTSGEDEAQAYRFDTGDIYDFKFNSELKAPDRSALSKE